MGELWRSDFVLGGRTAGHARCPTVGLAAHGMGIFARSFGPCGNPSVVFDRKAVPISAPHESRMPLSGGDLAFTMAGTAPAALLLIHGLGGSRQTWRHLIPALARTHTVIAPDLPGHGESDPPAGDYSLGAHACAMRDLLLALGHRRASLIGHSLGGGVAEPVNLFEAPVSGIY